MREAVGYALKQEGFEVVTLADDGEDADGKLGATSTSTC